MEWIKEHFPAITGAFGFLTSLVGGTYGVFKWQSARLDAKMSTQIALAVNDAVLEIMEDFAQVRERVSALEAHFMESKEDIQEIKGKLDSLGGHVLSLPDKLAEVLKK